MSAFGDFADMLVGVSAEGAPHDDSPLQEATPVAGTADLLKEIVDQADAEAGAFGGSAAAAAAAYDPEDDGVVQAGSVPSGTYTGVPTWARFQSLAIIPFSAIGARNGPTKIVSRTRESKEIQLTAPAAGFSIYVGDAGVQPAGGSNTITLPAGVPFEIILPGGQELYAVTDAPSFLTLQVQISPLLVGDREREIT